MELYKELKQLVEEMETDVSEFYGKKKNSTAGTRVRVNLQRVRELAVNIRFEISRIKKERKKEKDAARNN